MPDLSPDSIIAELLALEEQRAAALVACDLAALERITADDYTHVETQGTLRTRADFLAATSRPGHRFVSFVIDENHVRVYGDTAIVSGQYHNQVRTPAGLQPVKHARHLRVYVRREGVWRNVAHQATAVGPPGQPISAGSTIR